MYFQHMSSPQSEMLKLENQLCFSLYSASLAMTKAYQPFLKPLGLTYSQFLVLTVLWETDNVTVSAIGDRLFLDSGTLTPLLKKLEASGFISRERSSTDERQVLIRLTTKGQNVRKKAMAFPDALLTACQCSVQETKILIKKIKKIRDSLIHDNNLNLKPKIKQKEDL